MATLILVAAVLAACLAFVASTRPCRSGWHHHRHWRHGLPGRHRPPGRLP